ncbi:toxin Cry1Ac domain D-VI-related protein [Listeria booriae]|uniref:S-layer protein n=1 Tax=Listeria booriae TaxID=1552123 RepID=A0A842EZY8_9LIST|nr:toxin Cry1Ac domain D-VI-related protein [Listeria booriae]MBC2242254.1 S-layer protein [Listeria booriae]
MSKKKKIILGAILAVLIVGGSVTGGVLYHQEQVKAEQQTLVQQKQAKKLAAEREDSKQNTKATKTVVALFGSNDFKLLADDYTDDRLQNAKQVVANLKNATTQKELTEKISQANTLATQVNATTKRVQGLFKDTKKEALAAGIKQETITSVKQDITKKTPQKAAQEILTKDVNKAGVLYQKLVAAQEKTKQQEKKVAGNSTVSTADATEAKESANKQSNAAEAGETSKGVAGSSSAGGGNTDTSTNTGSGVAASSESNGSASTSKNEQSKASSSSSKPSGTDNNQNSSSQSSSANQPTVAKMNLASRTNQIITVIASGSSANVRFWEKTNGSWKQVFNVDGRVGSQGVGAADEYHSRTPRGAYSLGFAFGTSNPGTGLSFQQITNKSYWISNVNDPQYNTWQERSSSNKADEHMADYPTQYRYGVVINYNTSRTPGAGSGFFLHCSNGAATAGCVSIPTDSMRTVLQKLNGGAYIVNVTSESELLNY